MSSIRTIGIVGTGLIGSGWAAFFLSQGFDVVATDAAPDAEGRLRDHVARMWPDLQNIGLADGASPARLRYVDRLEDALAAVDFVQESTPERLPLKQDLYRQMDAILPASVIIASSSSGLMMGDIQQGCARFPDRCVVAHPFNPPHLIPLVEIVGGRQTSAATLDDAQTFFESLGKQCIRLNKEIRGHVANRIAWALYKEVLWLIEQGYVSVADADKAVASGPGLRWAGMGPTLLYHLGGGAGGLGHFLAQLGESLKDVWATSGTPDLTPDFQRQLIAAIEQDVGDVSIDTLSRQRDAFLTDLLIQRDRAAGAVPIGTDHPDTHPEH